MNGSAEGIVVLQPAANGSLENHGLAVVADSPSFLASSGDVVYAAGEGARVVSAYRVAGNELHVLSVQDTAGELPCALAVLGDRAALAVACYGDGTVDVHAITASGALGKTAQSLRGDGKVSRINQSGPHAHAILELGDGTVLTTDLGNDVVYVHTLSGGLLERTGSVSFPKGSGPRDLYLHSSGHVWMLTENSHEIFVLKQADGTFEIVSSVALPGAEDGDHSSAIAVSADGRFAYSGLRGGDTIATLAVGADGATLTPVGSVWCGGGWPRHLVIDGEYLRVANQLSNSVVTFTLGEDGLPVQHSTLVVQSPTYLLLG
jgi:6-phosphogluconolactonase (cycloisomerase 2 family)